jgi:hypothetical protein
MGAVISMNVLSPSGLREVVAADDAETWYSNVMEYNINRLNNTLLKTSGMADVQWSTPSDEDGFMWDSSLQKYVPRPQNYTTTSTTTTTTV